MSEDYSTGGGANNTERKMSGEKVVPLRLGCTPLPPIGCVRYSMMPLEAHRRKTRRAQWMRWLAVDRGGLDERAMMLWMRQLVLVTVSKVFEKCRLAQGAHNPH